MKNAGELLDTLFFYPAEGGDAVACCKTTAALSSFSRTDTADIAPSIRFLITGG
ncbi:MAG: hypothetical protein KDJ38_19480 [Gammaproteobacteria bacterium]|nr:hypothetical protein [Gammaproteobacteria bacterium]